jgi:hypothetical protein
MDIKKLLETYDDAISLIEERIILPYEVDFENSYPTLSPYERISATWIYLQAQKELANLRIMRHNIKESNAVQE